MPVQTCESDDLATARFDSEIARIDARVVDHWRTGELNGRCARLLSRALDRTHRRDEPFARQTRRLVFRRDSAIDHDDDAVASFEDLVQAMRYEDASETSGGGPTNMLQQLPRRLVTERRRRLVENHTADLGVAFAERAGYFDHLPLANRQILDSHRRIEAMIGEDSVQRTSDTCRQPACASRSR